MIIQCNKLTKSFGVEVVLKDVTFTLEDGEKAAIIGANGAGKTTLLKAVTGEVPHDGGELSFRKDIKIGYLAQLSALNADNTIEREALSVFASLVKKEEELRELETKLGVVDGQTDKLFERYDKLTREFESAGGYEYRSRVRGALNGLGFSSEYDKSRKISTLSGGQKTKVALAKLLLSEYDLLLLDEPTNHLDIANVEWLERFCADYRGAILLVSHDRYFIDRTVGKIIEIENGKTVTYNGDYAHYAWRKATEREQALELFERQQKTIKREEAIIRRFHSWATERAHKTAQSREKRLAKVERAEKPDELPDAIRLTLTPRMRSGNDVLTVKYLSKSFGSKLLFKNVSFEVKRGEKVALVGANGVGKTTMLNMIMSSQSSGLERWIKFGTNVEPAYFDQEYTRLDENKTAFDEISDAFPTLTNTEIRDTLAAFALTGDDVFKRVAVLSGGEKGRVLIAKLMLSNANLLLLDEPTNHLDIVSKEVLESALKAYAGTVLYVSHDRWFINNTADKVLEMSAEGVTEYVGDYDYYVEKKRFLADLAALNAEDGDGEPNGSAAPSENDSRKSSRSDERKRAAALRRLEKEISDAEARVAELDALLSSEEAGADAVLAAAAYEERETLIKSLDGLYEAWGSHDG